MKYVLGLFILISFSAYATDNSNPSDPDDPKDSNISDLVIPTYESIDIADYSKKNCEMKNGKKKCRPETSKLKKGSKIRILSKDKGGNYNIEVFSRAGYSQGTYHTSTKYADKALNWSAVNHTLGLLGSPKGDWNYSNY